MGNKYFHINVYLCFSLISEIQVFKSRKLGNCIDKDLTGEFNCEIPTATGYFKAILLFCILFISYHTYLAHAGQGLQYIRFWVECNTVVALNADRDAAEVNKYHEVNGPGGQLPKAAPTRCTKGRGLVVIPMPAQPIFAGVGNSCTWPVCTRSISPS